MKKLTSDSYPVHEICQLKTTVFNIFSIIQNDASIVTVGTYSSFHLP